MACALSTPSKGPRVDGKDCEWLMLFKCVLRSSAHFSQVNLRHTRKLTNQALLHVVVPGGLISDATILREGTRNAWEGIMKT